MIVLGVLAATDALARGAPAARDPQLFYIVALTDILIFAVPLSFAFPSGNRALKTRRGIFNWHF